MEESKQKLGIEETLEVVRWLNLVAADLAEHMTDDGKLDGFEVTKTLLSNAPGAIKAFSGIDKVDDEIKDLDDSEKEQLVSEAMALVMSLVRTFYKKEG